MLTSSDGVSSNFWRLVWWTHCAHLQLSRNYIDNQCKVRRLRQLIILIVFNDKEATHERWYPNVFEGCRAIVVEYHFGRLVSSGQNGYYSRTVERCPFQCFVGLLFRSDIHWHIFWLLRSKGLAQFLLDNEDLLKFLARTPDDGLCRHAFAMRPSRMMSDDDDDDDDISDPVWRQLQLAAVIL